MYEISCPCLVVPSLLRDPLPLQNRIQAETGQVIVASSEGWCLCLSVRGCFRSEETAGFRRSCFATESKVSVSRRPYFVAPGPAPHQCKRMFSRRELRGACRIQRSAWSDENLQVLVRAEALIAAGPPGSAGATKALLLVLLWHFMQKLAVVEQHGYSLACLTARPKPTRLRGTMLHRSLQSSSSTSQNRNAERAMNFVRPSRSSFGGFCRPAKPLSAKARSALLATHSHFDYLPSSASQQGPLRPDADVIGARMSRVLSYSRLTTLR